AEDEGVDGEQQQRVGERPEEAEHRAAVAGLELARGQGGEEPAEAEELIGDPEHAGRESIIPAPATLPPRGRLESGGPAARPLGGAARSAARLGATAMVRPAAGPG